LKKTFFIIVTVIFVLGVSTLMFAWFSALNHYEKIKKKIGEIPFPQKVKYEKQALAAGNMESLIYDKVCVSYPNSLYKRFSGESGVNGLESEKYKINFMHAINHLNIAKEEGFVNYGLTSDWKIYHAAYYSNYIKPSIFNIKEFKRNVVELVLKSMMLPKGVKDRFEEFELDGTRGFILGDIVKSKRTEVQVYLAEMDLYVCFYIIPKEGEKVGHEVVVEVLNNIKISRNKTDQLQL
jgi:hypothetical protein